MRQVCSRKRRGPSRVRPAPAAAARHARRSARSGRGVRSRSRRADRREPRQHRDVDREARQLAGAHRCEALVLGRGRHGHARHRESKRLVGSQQAHAAAQLAVARRRSVTKAPRGSASAPVARWRLRAARPARRASMAARASRQQRAALVLAKVVAVSLTSRPAGRRQVADDAGLVALARVAAVGVAQHAARSAPSAAPPASPPRSARRRRHARARPRAAPSAPRRRSARTSSTTCGVQPVRDRRRVVVAEVARGDEQRAARPASAPRQGAPPARRPRPAIWRAHQHRHDAQRLASGAAGTAAASRASARSRCGRRRRRQHPASAASSAAASSSSIGRRPSGVSKAPRAWTATPSKATRCDGPTSTTRQRRRPRSERVAVGRDRARSSAGRRAGCTSATSRPGDRRRP